MAICPAQCLLDTCTAYAGVLVCFVFHSMPECFASISSLLLEPLKTFASVVYGCFVCCVVSEGRYSTPPIPGTGVLGGGGGGCAGVMRKPEIRANGL